jgi:hypothetical protein
MIADPAEEMLKRAAEIRQQEEAAKNGAGLIDEQELAEREQAAQAYFGEDEKHFTDYLADCIKTSVAAMEGIREIQSHCYRVYKEDEPVIYQKKSDWQSRIVVPRPFASVQYGASAVKKAFTPKFLTVTNTRNKLAGEFWKRLLDVQLNEQHAQFGLRFTDATTMGLAVGTSMEMIARYLPGRGLEFVLIEPWKIHRDPDAMPRDCQSGMYWVHQEWLDYFVLLEGQKKGQYRGVEQVKSLTGEDPNNPFLTKEAIAARKAMIWERSGYRSMILTSEYWGIVLDKQGNVLLPSATFTDAGGRIIAPPKAVKYPHIRWPGIAFSPLPDLLTFNGRGLLEGVISIWEAMCNLMCLHSDNLAWLVNPMVEIISDLLVNPDDAETWPGKEYQVKESIAGNQVIRTVDRRSITNEVLANMQYHDQNYQRGTMVNDAVQGLPGYRQDMTFREAAQNLDQALGVFSLMGENIEYGAITAIMAAADLIGEAITIDDLRVMFDEEELTKYGITIDTGTGKPAGIPSMDGSFHVSGIQSLMKENEVMQTLKNLVIPLATNPRFAPYIKPYEILKAIEERVNIKDEGIFVTEEEAKNILAAEAERGKADQAADAKEQELAETQAALDAMIKIRASKAQEQGAAAKNEITKLDAMIKSLDAVLKIKQARAAEMQPPPGGPNAG